MNGGPHYHKWSRGAVGSFSYSTGVRAMRKNYDRANVGFAEIVATARANRELRQYMTGWEHEMDSVPDDVKDAKVSFGFGP